MKKNIINTILTYTLMTFLLASNATFTPQKSNELIDNSSISTYANKCEWRYKTEDGKLYKRLYDTTTLSWVGDWILVR